MDVCDRCAVFGWIRPQPLHLGESFGGALQPRQVDKCAREKLDVAIREEIASMEERRLQAIAR